MFRLPRRWNSPLLQQQILDAPVRLLEFIPTSTQMLPSSEMLWDHSLDPIQAFETFHARLHHCLLHAYSFMPHGDTVSAKFTKLQENSQIKVSCRFKSYPLASLVLSY